MSYNLALFRVELSSGSLYRTLTHPSGKVAFWKYGELLNFLKSLSELLLHLQLPERTKQAENHYSLDCSSDSSVPGTSLNVF